MDDLHSTIRELGSAFEAFKAKHSEELAELKKKGSVDVLTTEALQKIEARMSELEAQKAKIEKLEALAARAAVAGRDRKENSTPEQLKHAEAFEAWLRSPHDSERQQDLLKAGLEAKAISSSTASAGHAIPEVIGRRIQETLQLMSPMRQVVDVIQVGTSDYKELVDVNGETGGWVGETTTRTATAEPALEQVAPTMGEVYAHPAIYEHILDDAFFDVEAWLVRKVTDELARLEGIAFISGNGSNKPTGFLNGTPVAIGDFDSPARDFGDLQYIPTGVSGGFEAIGSGVSPGDVFIDTIHALRPRWRQGAVWLMNTTTKGTVRKFKDSEGNYLLRPGLEMGEGSQLLGYNVVEMDHMPDEGAAAFPIAFGNFREGYLAVERTSLRITVDDNITTPGTIKWYVRRRVGGILRQDQAIKLIKQATS